MPPSSITMMYGNGNGNSNSNGNGHDLDNQSFRSTSGNSTQGSLTVAASLFDHFSWLRPPPSVRLETSTVVPLPLQDKQVLVGQCLSGSLNDRVNLWHLRQLSLTEGGLVSSTLRKQAWPKLLCAYPKSFFPGASQSHYHVPSFGTPSSPATATTTQTTRTSNRTESVHRQDYKQLQRDIQKTKWPIESLVLQARHRQAMIDSANRPRKVHFPGTPLLDSTVVVPASQDDVSYLSGGNGLGTPVSVAYTAVYLSKHEQSVLANIITSFLQTPPADESVFFEDDRYRYFGGLNDLTALLLIHLESPSLTKLCLQKLGEWHLRDAAREPHVIESLVRLALPILLEHSFDNSDPNAAAVMEQLLLQLDVVLQGVTDWVRCWFARHVQQLPIMSRLLDVLLSSHAMMPIYFSAALLSHPNAKTVLLEDIHGSSGQVGGPMTSKKIKQALSTLPGVVLEQPQSMTQQTGMGLDDGQLDNNTVTDGTIVAAEKAPLEEILEKALGLMQQLPPSLLQQRWHPEGAKFAMLSTPATPSTALTDWALLQQAKRQRSSTQCRISPKSVLELPDSLSDDSDDVEAKEPNKSTTNTTERDQQKEDEQEQERLDRYLRDYPLAGVAAGLYKEPTKSKRWSTVLLLAIAMVVVALAGVIAMATASASSGPRGSTLETRSSSKTVQGRGKQNRNSGVLNNQRKKKTVASVKNEGQSEENRPSVSVSFMDLFKEAVETETLGTGTKNKKKNENKTNDKDKMKDTKKTNKKKTVEPNRSGTKKDAAETKPKQAQPVETKKKEEKPRKPTVIDKKPQPIKTQPVDKAMAEVKKPPVKTKPAAAVVDTTNTKAKTTPPVMATIMGTTSVSGGDGSATIIAKDQKQKTASKPAAKKSSPPLPPPVKASAAAPNKRKKRLPKVFRGIGRAVRGVGSKLRNVVRRNKNKTINVDNGNKM